MFFDPHLTTYQSNIRVWLRKVSEQPPCTWGPLHTQDCKPVTITLQALSLVEKAEPVQVCFTLCLRDRRSMWTQDGCKVYMDYYMASKGLCFVVTWIIFENNLFEVGLTPNRETTTLTIIDLFCFYHVGGPVWIEVPWKSIWLRTWSHMTSHYTSGIRDHTTWCWRCVGTAFGHFLLGSQNFMDAALGFCVKWPSPITNTTFISYTNLSQTSKCMTVEHGYAMNYQPFIEMESTLKSREPT
jgi:hypothetical protein